MAKRNNITELGERTHKDVFKDKHCVVCDACFKPRSGVHKFCSQECKGKWKHITGVVTTESQYVYITGNWRRYLSRLCCRSHKRKDLTVEELLEILEKQDFKCALSGLELTCKLEKGNRFLTNASIDRIEAGGPYIKENVQLVCSALNGFRRDVSLSEFIWWCRKVVEFNDGEN